MNEDEDDGEDGELSGMAARWESFSDDFLMFERIPESERSFSSPDLCAWALLDKRFPSKRNFDMVSNAEHDEIWLRIKPEQIAQLTDDEILYLVRCGIMYDADSLCLHMFA